MQVLIYFIIFMMLLLDDVDLNVSLLKHFLNFLHFWHLNKFKDIIKV